MSTHGARDRPPTDGPRLPIAGARGRCHSSVRVAAIITDRFVPTAQAMARVSGMPGLPFAVIPHPISGNGGAELRAKATSAVQQCVAILTQP